MAEVIDTVSQTTRHYTDSSLIYPQATIMRMYLRLSAIALTLISVSSLAKPHYCKEFNNEQARQNCRERHDEQKRDCYALKNSHARENCRNSQSNHHADADRNDKMYQPNQQHSVRTKSLKEAQQFCVSAHSALDHEACMSGQGYSQR